LIRPVEALRGFSEIEIFGAVNIQELLRIAID
jgi:hypothetical protein